MGGDLGDVKGFGTDFRMDLRNWRVLDSHFRGNDGCRRVGMMVEEDGKVGREGWGQFAAGGTAGELL